MVVVDSRQVHVHTGGVDPGTGTGPPLVLIHGAGQDHSVWAYQTRLLANLGMPAYAVDLPGHGRSDGPPLGSIVEMADWLDRFLDAVEASAPLVVGHSMGSFVAIEHAAGHKGRVGALVLTGTSDRMPVHPDLLAAAETGDDAAAELITGWSHTGVDRFGGNPSPGLWAKGMTSRLAERTLDGALSIALQSVVAYDPIKRAGDVTCPVVVAVAAQDKMADPGGARRLADAFAFGSVVELPGGHGGMLDHPRAVAAVIADAHRHLATTTT